MNPAPKPKAKRKGRAVRRDRSMADAARRRDGTCLYGMLYHDGCVPGYDPHHIVSFGSDPRQDVLENLVCLCRKHHNMAEAREISAITLQGILYHFYGYGPREDIRLVMDDMRRFASDYGLTALFELSQEQLDFKAVGFVSRFARIYTWDDVLSTGFITQFESDLASSQRVVSYG